MKAKKNHKHNSIEEYIENYCQEKRIRGRFAVYITPETHSKLRSIALLFKRKHHTTTSSLADSIISQHIEIHKELLDNAHREDSEKFLEYLKETKVKNQSEI